jgi:hypothetical protein
MAIARRHHVIMSAYLEGFAVDPDKPQLHVFDLVRRKTRIALPRSVAWVRDFNTIAVPGREPDEVERMLSQVEGDVIAAFRRIDAVGSSNRQEFQLVLNLMALFIFSGSIGHPCHVTLTRPLRCRAVADLP